MSINHLRLVPNDSDLDISALEREFPTVAIEYDRRCQPGDVVIDDFAWRGAFDFRRFDELIEDERGTIAVRGDDAAGVACEVLGRYQRLIARRNAASKTSDFDAVLRAHATIYDDFDDRAHALDTWQWILRLDPEANLTVQLGALFHDIDRLEKAPHERLEHRVREEGCVRAGERAYAVLSGVGLLDEASRVAHLLIEEHREPSANGLLLDDADALSFLSLHSPRYADHFGLAQTRRKVMHTVGRLGALAREKLALVRIRPDVDRLMHQVAA